MCRLGGTIITGDNMELTKTEAHFGILGIRVKSISRASQVRGVCPRCEAKEKPLHRLSQREYVCAKCARNAKKKER